jgi:hypothetical protein
MISPDEKQEEPVEVPSLISFIPSAFKASGIPNCEAIVDIF